MTDTQGLGRLQEVNVATDLIRSARSFQPSIFTTMTETALKYGAINLAQGVPDFEPPTELIESARDALRRGLHQYTPSIGLQELRESIARHVNQQYGVQYDADSEVTVTSGATEAIWSAVTALLGPGDEAIIVAPFYELYPACVTAAGGKPRFVQTRFPEFRLDLDELESAFCERTRLVFLNTPANPSGTLLTREARALVGSLAEKHGAFVISDETYEHILFDDAVHTPVAAEPSCTPRTITVSSVSKTFSATGWRIGWALGPRQLTDPLRRVHQFVVFAAPTALQKAVADVLTVAAQTDYLRRLRQEFAARRETLLAYLREAGLEATQPQGAYFVMVKIDRDDVEFCETMASRNGVAAMPGSYFFDRGIGGRRLIRLSFCKKQQTLQEAGRRLVAAVRELA